MNTILFLSLFSSEDNLAEHSDTVSPVMVPLGTPSGMQTEETKEAFGELLMTRKKTPALWEEKLTTLLSLILKNIGDDEVRLSPSPPYPHSPFIPPSFPCLVLLVWFRDCFTFPDTVCNWRTKQ